MGQSSFLLAFCIPMGLGAEGTRAMKQLSVVILGLDEEQRAILQMQVDASAVARAVQVFPTFPVGAADATIRRIEESGAEVVLVDVPREGAGAALHAIELIHVNVPKGAVFAVGDTAQPQVIIGAMRAGAREFLERPTSTTALLDAFVRLTSSKRKNENSVKRGKLFTFVNVKGGAGCTTISVNTAVALQNLYGGAALVDLAPLGHATLHLNERPEFSLMDALRNVHRLDPSLLDVYMARCSSGLHLLPAGNEPMTEVGSSSDYARVFDSLLAQYSYVVVDASNRVDGVTRVICDLSHKVFLISQTDVASLWSTAKLQERLGVASDRLFLLINRYRKIPGLSDTDIEAATHTKVMWKFPNQYATVSAAIDKGAPLVEQNHTDIARCFVSFANTLSEQTEQQVKRRTFSLFGAGS